MRSRSGTELHGDVLFREEQGYGWPWPGILIVLAGVATLSAVLVPFGYGMWQQLVQGKPWGDKPMSDAAFAVVGPLSMLLSLLPIGVYFSRLRVEVRTDGLRVELWPFLVKRVVSARDVREANLGECGAVGWGARRLGSREYYRMAGPRVVRLVLAHGEVSIGSAHPHRLLEAVQRMIGASPRP